MTDAIKPDICLYHANCADGFAAAWAIWKRWGDDTAYQAVRYGDTPPDIAGKHVLIVDFSYKAPVLREMAKAAASITILDHHKSAMEDLEAFLEPDMGKAFLRRTSGAPHGEVFVTFDMAKSGARLAWEYAHPGQVPPALVSYVEDRDLWRFAMDGSKQVHAFLMSLPYSFQAWSDAQTHLTAHPTSRSHLMAAGEAILRSQAKAIDEALALSRRTITIAGHIVPVANVPKAMASDATNIMAQGQPFAACYFDTATGKREFSLRSSPDGADVAKIAEAFGGGGHARAAGFTVGGGWEGEAS
jgi:oligoribonuclease NrnB/cAMP/cGMP phosphodiesterase (DHH superfamily)